VNKFLEESGDEVLQEGPSEIIAIDLFMGVPKSIFNFKVSAGDSKKQIFNIAVYTWHSK
jgi:hypothetical protein